MYTPGLFLLIGIILGWLLCKAKQSNSGVWFNPNTSETISQDEGGFA